MREGTQVWVEHVAAVKREGLSAVAYARQHGISIKSLYYWQHKLKVAALAKPGRTSNFVAVRLGEAPMLRAGHGCTLVLPSGLRLEMSALPSTEWLATLTRSMQSAR